MAKCDRCGSELVEGKAFCVFCGARVDAEESNKKNNFDFSNMLYSGKDCAGEFDARDIVESKPYSILSYLGILFIVGLIVRPDSKVTKFHANQGLILFIIEMAFIITGVLIGIIPIIGWIIGALIGVLVCSLLIAVFVYELINILDDKVKKLPLIGNITIIK